MDCPNCGYALSPFDKECPRCVYLAKTQPVPPPTLQMSSQPVGASTGQTQNMKRCPQCGNLLVQYAQHCPVCKYHYPDPTVTVQNGAFCSSCGQAIEYGVRFCKHCGASQQPHSQIPAPPQLIQPQVYLLQQPVYDVVPPAKIGLISAMWILTALQIIIMVGTAGSGFALAFLLDIPAFVIAIILVCSKNGTDKGNGWAKLSLEMVGFVISLVAAASRPY